MQAAPQTPDAMADTSRHFQLLIFTDFVYPFELTSFLILVAIMGAMVLAQREKS